MSADALQPGEVRAGHSPAGDDVVLFRTARGDLGCVARTCPHLDWDLADAFVAGEELVCPGHGWSFTIDGRALKRNELGRCDDKGRTTAWAVVATEAGVIVGDPLA